VNATPRASLAANEETLFEECQQLETELAAVTNQRDELLEKLNSPVTFRYFTTGKRFWKMPICVQGFGRMMDEQWSDSICDIQDMIRCGLREITAEEGEP
jgi:hypothetical protein